MENNTPPFYNPPPPYVAPRASGRSGRGWMVVSLVLAVILVCVLLGVFARSMASFGLSGAQAGRQSGHWLEEVSVEDNSSANKIVIVDVEGIITSQGEHIGRNMVDLIEDQLKLAAKDSSVKAVILKVDSPGGEVLASDDISRAIIDFQEKEGKPVIAAMGGMAASGGYYISAPCQWIVANELTITGSIGVIMHSLNYRGLMDKVGLYPQVFKSGRFKDMLSGTKEPSEVQPEERQMIQNLINETYGKFKSVVSAGRKRAAEKNKSNGRKLTENWEEYADGRILSGNQAYELGFVDEKGNFDTAVSRTKKIAGISDANLIRYQEPFKLSSLFNIFGKTDVAKIKVDLGMDLPKLQAGRLYFLSETLLQ
jgi:protease-4